MSQRTDQTYSEKTQKLFDGLKRLSWLSTTPTAAIEALLGPPHFREEEVAKAGVYRRLPSGSTKNQREPLHIWQPNCK